MKTKAILLSLFISMAVTTHAQVAINTDGAAPDESAMLDISSTDNDKGLLIPRMEQTQREAISHPATGLLVYQTDGTAGFYYNLGTPDTPSWIQLSSTLITQIADADGDTKVQVEESTDEDHIRFDVEGSEAMAIDNSGNVGIGTSTPNYSLDITGDAVADILRLRRASDGSETVHTILDAGGHIQYYNSSGNRGHDFITNDGATVESRMRIIGNGDVGIGTTTPSQKLEVVGNITQTDGDYTATDQVRAIDADGIKLYDDGGNGIFIEDGGNVGIGTATPTAELHVGGTDGFLVEGTYDSGSIPATGAGIRMMWYPKKGAFRVGGVASSQWNDSNIGSYSTAMGYTTTANGFNSTAMGNQVNASGTISTAMGYSTTASGNYSTAMGSETIASGDFGSTAMSHLTTASGWASTAMGINTTAQALASLVIGQNNVISGTTNSWEWEEPVFVIGNGSNSDSRSNAMTVLKNGHVGINTSSPLSQLHIKSQGNNGDAVILIDAEAYSSPRIRLCQGGVPKWDVEVLSTTNSFFIYNEGRTKYAALTQTCDAWIFGSASDKRLKENITVKEDVLKDLLKLNAVNYNYTTSTQKEIGLIAQEVEKYFPEIVNGEETDSTYLSIVYSHLTPILLQGIKELNTEKEKLEIRIQKLEEEKGEIGNRNKEMETRITKLELMMTKMLQSQNIEVVSR